MVDRERVDQLLALLRRYVGFLRDLSSEEERDFHSDPRIRGSAERYLQLAIETTLNIGHHLVAALGLRQPGTYGEVYRVLAEAGVLDEAFAITIEPMAAMRNRLVHVYWEVDPAQLRELLLTRTSDFDDFARAVTTYLDKHASEATDATD